MAADPFGPEFLKNLDREFKKFEYHDRGGRDPAPQPQAEPRAKVKGKPGSPERFEYAASLIEDPELRQQLVGELAWGQVGVELQNALHRIKADEGRDDFYDYDDPAYRPETVEAFTRAARLIAQTGAPELYEAFQNELGEDSPLQEYLAPAVEHAETEGRIESYGLQQAAEEKRLGEREKMLNTEYEQIAKRTGPAGITAADRLAQAFDQEGLLYHPAADDDQLRAQLRATAETVRAQERGMRQATFLTEFDKEAARAYGPGSSWNDAEREKWETELRTGTVETVERAFGDPNDHADRAINSMIDDDRRAATGKGSFERALDAELDEHNSHARQNSPHLRALAEADAREWERTHDESGFPTTATDGLGHEHRRRGSPGE